MFSYVCLKTRSWLSTTYHDLAVCDANPMPLQTHHYCEDFTRVGGDVIKKSEAASTVTDWSRTGDQRTSRSWRMVWRAAGAVLLVQGEAPLCAKTAQSPLISPRPGDDRGA